MRKLPAALLTLAMLVSIFTILQPLPVRAAGSSIPAALTVTPVPKLLPADGGVYPAVYVGLADSTGAATLAVTDVTVYLTSATPAVGIVLNSTLVIPAGRGYAMAAFQTTPTVGSTVVTASAQGLSSGNAQVATAVLRGYPATISVTAVPSEVNSTSTSSRTGTVIVELQDQVGQPAKAPVDTQVSVYSSSPKIVALNATSFIMRAGQFLKVLSFSTGYVPGSAVVTASAPQLTSGTAQVTVLGRPPLALQIYAQPGQLMTSESGRLVIALTDLNGNPTRAPTATVVQISSSSTAAVSAPSTATIPAGAIYTTVTMNTGPTRGNATITVSSSGLRSGFVSLVTLPPSNTPVGLKLFIAPSPILADHGNYSAVVVSLVSNSGTPAVSLTSYTVTLTSSQNSSVGAFGPSAFSTATIPAGKSYVVWPIPFTSTFVAGATALTVSAQNLLPDTGTLTTFGAVPSKLAVSSLFTAVPADGGSHPAVEVALEDSTGSPAVATTPVTVFLSSTQTGILQVNSPIVILPGESAVVAQITATAVSGSANVTAYTNSLSLGYVSASVVITTITPSPAQVGAYFAPASLAPSPFQKNAVLVLQLQDSNGNPSKARQPTTLTVTSSDNAIFNQTLQVQIAQGASYAVVPIAPMTTGTTTFTITSPGLTSASAKLQTLDSPYSELISASSLSIFMNQTATITLSILIDGQGVSGANVTWSTSTGLISPQASVTSAAGVATTLLSPKSPGVANVTAFITSPVTGSKALSSLIIITATPPSSNKGLVGTLLSFPYLEILVAVVAVVVLLVVLLFRRRRAAKAEESIEEEPGFNFYVPRPSLGFSAG